jgi:hypothetical protein
MKEINPTNVKFVKLAIKPKKGFKDTHCQFMLERNHSNVLFATLDLSQLPLKLHIETVHEGN